jgi:glucokinase
MGPAGATERHGLREEAKAAMGLTIGVDIGGTKIAAGVVDEQGKILSRVRRDTPAQDGKQTVQAIAACINELVADHEEIIGAGLGAPGFIDAARSTVLFTPNLPWRNEPLRAEVEQLTGLPVVVENDANAAAWGESVFGAGNAQPYTITLTVGTGLGGGIVINGVLVRGAFGVAAEVGHINIVPDGLRCGCGLLGCWEQYASGSALVREARELAARSPENAGRLLKLGDGTPEKITGPQVTRAAREGDPIAIEALYAIGHWLGHGMADLAATLDPRLFIIGGGVSEAGALIAVPARESFKARLTARGHRPEAEVRLAQLGQDAGLIGAADLARR